MDNERNWQLKVMPESVRIMCKKFGVTLGKFLYKMEEIIEETLEHHEDIVKNWTAIFDLMIELEMAIANTHDEDTFGNSMVMASANYFPRSVLYAFRSVLSAMYEPAVRELRFLVEHVLQAFYIDQTMGDADLKAKTRVVTTLEDARLRGLGLAKKCRLHSDIRRSTQNVYSRLCAFVHPSKTVLAEMTREHPAMIVYINESFQTALEFHWEVYDTLISIVLCRFPDARDWFFSNKGVRDILSNLGFKLTSMTEQLSF